MSSNNETFDAGLQADSILMTPNGKSANSCIPPSPLTFREVELLDVLQRVIDLNDSDDGPAPSNSELTLYSKLSHKLIRYLSPKKPDTATTATTSSIMVYNQQPDDMNVTGTLKTPSNDSSPSRVVKEDLIDLCTSVKQMIISPTSPVFDLKDLNIRMTIIDRLSAKIRIVLAPFLTGSIEQFSSWSPKGNEVLSFLLMISNTLAHSGANKDFWIPAILGALTGSKLLLYFQEHHSLPMSESNVFSFTREICPEDISSWSFDLFMAELFRLFNDNRFIDSISRYMSTWTTTTFKDIKTALDIFKNIMSQLVMHQHHSKQTANLVANCETYKHYFWRCFDFSKANPDFAMICFNITTHMPLNAKDKAPFKLIDRAFREYFEYSSALIKHKTPIITDTHDTHDSSHASPHYSSKPKQVNSILAHNPNVTCTHCNLPGHLEIHCFKLHPELKRELMCGKCRVKGHSTRNCPSFS